MQIQFFCIPYHMLLQSKQHDILYEEIIQKACTEIQHRPFFV